MAAPFVFTYRHLGYKLGCVLLLLATVLAICGLMFPGWYSVEDSYSGRRFYSHLWFVCNDGFYECQVLAAGSTKAFEKATQAFAVLGVLGHLSSCLLAVYLNFMTLSKRRHRWLQLIVLIAGGATFLAALIFAAANTTDPDNVVKGKTSLTATNGYALMLSTICAVITFVAAVLLWVFDRPLDHSATDRRSTSALRYIDAMELTHLETEGPEGGFGDASRPHRSAGSPPHYMNFQPSACEADRQPQPGLESDGTGDYRNDRQQPRDSQNCAQPRESHYYTEPRESHYYVEPRGSRGYVVPRDSHYYAEPGDPHYYSQPDESNHSTQPNAQDDSPQLCSGSSSGGQGSHPAALPRPGTRAVHEEEDHRSSGGSGRPKTPHHYTSLHPPRGSPGASGEDVHMYLPLPPESSPPPQGRNRERDYRAVPLTERSVSDERYEDVGAAGTALPRLPVPEKPTPQPPHRRLYENIPPGGASRQDLSDQYHKETG